MTLYFAYGSNLNLEGMRRRCPKAKPLGKFFLQEARLVFRGVADCIHEAGSKCPGAIWRITPECEEMLDRYEGVAGGMYRKTIVPLSGFADESEQELMLYQMNSTGIMPPGEWYFDTIRRGYRDFGLSTRALNEALRHSHKFKHLTHKERQRLRRTGRRPFAMLPPEPVQESLALAAE